MSIMTTDRPQLPPGLPTPDWCDEDYGVALYRGDCLEVMGRMPDNSVDCVLTDPPYGLNYGYEGYDDTRENLRKLINGLFSYRNMFVRMIILCGPTQIHEYPESDWVGAITWDTTGSLCRFGFSQWTPILIYGDDVKRGFKSINGVLKSDTFHIRGGSSVGFRRSKEESLHPCPKSKHIMDYISRRYTNQRESIIDPFMGSGTTGVAAVNLGRAFIGIELEPKYFDIAVRRIRQAIIDRQGGELFAKHEPPAEANLFDKTNPNNLRNRNGKNHHRTS